jgi:hypothetical protein
MKKDITKEEWEGLIRTADKIVDYYTLSHSFCGGGEYVSIIEKDGMLYELHDWTGWWDNQKQEGWSISVLHKAEGQEGEGI